MEIWKDIKDFEDLYQVSNMGRVKSLERVVEFMYWDFKKTMHIPEKILKPQLNKNGYYVVHLSKGNKHTSKLVSRLVAEAFIPNIDNKPQIDHINTVRTDNRVENLRWCTQQENTDNPTSKEKHKKYYSEHIGSKHPCAKKYIQFTRDGELVKVWDSAVDVQNEIGIHQSHIGSCCTGNRQTAGGFRWKYYDTETYLIGLMNKNFKLLRNAS